MILIRGRAAATRSVATLTATTTTTINSGNNATRRYVSITAINKIKMSSISNKASPTAAAASSSSSSSSASPSSSSSSGRSIIVWYKINDLRLHDHGPLSAAFDYTSSFKRAFGASSVPQPQCSINPPQPVDDELPRCKVDRVVPMFVFDRHQQFGRCTMESIIAGPTLTRKRAGDRRVYKLDEIESDVTNYSPPSSSASASSSSSSSAADPLRCTTFVKTSARRALFTLQCVSDLRDSLRALGSDLLIRTTDPEDALSCARAIAEVAAQTNAVAVYTHAEYAYEELAVEKSVREALSKLSGQGGAGVKLHTWQGNTLYSHSDLPFAIGATSDVYTPFRSRVEGRVGIRAVGPYSIAGTSLDRSAAVGGVQLAAAGMNGFSLKPFATDVDRGEMPTLRELGYAKSEVDVIEAQPIHPSSSFPMGGGETSALKHLNNYLWTTNQVDDYKETRNELNGMTYSSKFSPFLSSGCLSTRLIYSELMRYESLVTKNDSTHWLVVELIFREHFRLLAEKYGNKIFMQYGPNKGARARLQPPAFEWNKDVNKMHAWCTGRTGYPFIDSCMRELLHSGYMSNRGRQVVASFFIHDMKMDWRLGAQWMESQLLDHDVASNHGNWSYQAGVAFDPRPDRYFNIHKQSQQYDPHASHVKLWIPELRAANAGGVVADRRQQQLPMSFFKPAAAAASASSSSSSSSSPPTVSPLPFAHLPYPKPICPLKSDSQPYAFKATDSIKGGGGVSKSQARYQQSSNHKQKNRDNAASAAASGAGTASAGAGAGSAAGATRGAGNGAPNGRQFSQRGGASSSSSSSDAAAAPSSSSSSSRSSVASAPASSFRPASALHSALNAKAASSSSSSSSSSSRSSGAGWQ